MARITMMIAAMVLFVAACDEEMESDAAKKPAEQSSLKCGKGVVEVNGTCVVNLDFMCAGGTEMSEGRCWPSPTSATCGEGTYQFSGECLPEIRHCGEGSYKEGNDCVAEITACAEGTYFSGDECIPKITSCGPGTKYSTLGTDKIKNGTCIPEIPSDCYSFPTSDGGSLWGSAVRIEQVDGGAVELGEWDSDFLVEGPLSIKLTCHDPFKPLFYGDSTIENLTVALHMRDFQNQKPEWWGDEKKSVRIYQWDFLSGKYVSWSPLSYTETRNDVVGEKTLVYTRENLLIKENSQLVIVVGFEEDDMNPGDMLRIDLSYCWSIADGTSICQPPITGKTYNF